jgi:methyl-accepting chemotaxis protein
MVGMSWLNSLEAEQIITLGCIAGFILSRNIDKADLAIIGLLIDNIGDTITTIAAIEAIQALEANKLDPPQEEAPANEQQNLGQLADDLYEAIKSLHEIVDELQTQNASLRREIQELHSKLNR